jgi:transcription elongation factor B subunit 1
MTSALLSKLQQSDSSSEGGEDQFKEEEEFPDEPPHLDYVTLIAKDGEQFHISRDAALVSGLLRALFSGDVEFAETESRQIDFPNIRGPVLKRVVEYMHHNLVWRNLLDCAPRFPIEDEILVEVLVAADYLNI